jgi:hypothetical protein
LVPVWGSWPALVARVHDMLAASATPSETKNRIFWGDADAVPSPDVAIVVKVLLTRKIRSETKKPRHAAGVFEFVEDFARV